MNITLRPPIDLYFASENARDSSAIDLCFAVWCRRARRGQDHHR